MREYSFSEAKDKQRPTEMRASGSPPIGVLWRAFESKHQKLPQVFYFEFPGFADFFGNIQFFLGFLEGKANPSASSKQATAVRCLDLSCRPGKPRAPVGRVFYGFSMVFFQDFLSFFWCFIFLRVFQVFSIFFLGCFICFGVFYVFGWVSMGSIPGFANFWLFFC